MTLQVDYRRIVDCVFAYAVATDCRPRLESADRDVLEMMVGDILEGVALELAPYVTVVDREQGRMEVDSRGRVGGEEMLHAVEREVIARCLHRMAIVAERPVSAIPSLRRRLRPLPGSIAPEL